MFKLLLVAGSIMALNVRVLDPNAHLRPKPGADRPANDDGCMTCDSYPGRHYDWYVPWGNDKHGGGGYHPSWSPSYGECNIAHANYNQFAGAQEALRLQHLAGRDPNQLLKAFVESDNAVLVPERRAVQVRSGGLVVLHLPLAVGEFTRLATAVAEMKGGMRVNGAF